MLSDKTINELAIKWQTNPFNVAREYVQHVFLSYLYQSKESEHLGFKGGTALRLLFKSPRFSEDLDFTGSIKPYHIEKILVRTVEMISKEIPQIEIIESKPTSGGYLAFINTHVSDMAIRIELNISLRQKPRLESILATTPLYPLYQCLILKTDDLVKEKCQALLTRKKPRDFFDLYFLIRERRGLSSIIPLKKSLILATQELDSKMLQKELKIFLPVSHHRIASNLQTTLLGELNRL